MPDLRDTELLRPHPPAHRPPTRRVGVRAVEGGVGAEVVVDGRHDQRVRRERGQTTAQLVPAGGGAGARGEVAAAARPVQGDPARQVLEPAEPPPREVPAGQRDRRHRRVPARPHPRPPRPRPVVPPVGVLPADGHVPGHVTRLVREPDAEPAVAVAHRQEGAGQVRPGPAEHGVRVEGAPVRPPRLPGHGERLAGLPDTPVVERDRVEPVAGEELGVAPVVRGLHPGRRGDHHRAGGPGRGRRRRGGEVAGREHEAVAGAEAHGGGGGLRHAATLGAGRRDLRHRPATQWAHD